MCKGLNFSFFVADKIEEAQKELKDPTSSQKGVSDSSRRNVDKSQSLKRKKVVAGNQLKKIPKSPVKKPLQSKLPDSAAQDTPDQTPQCSSSVSNSPTHLHTAPAAKMRTNSASRHYWEDMHNSKGNKLQISPNNSNQNACSVHGVWVARIQDISPDRKVQTKP
uniref:Uncharacterized protein n=1 Tax=Knipowitschia caucasica TaxID=637954 RepID=A0AAV2K1P3_KNICA